MLAELEQSILLYFQSIRNDFLTSILVPLTKAGDNGLCWMILAAALLVLCIVLKAAKVDKRLEYMPLTVGIAGIGGLLLEFLLVNMFIKKVVARIRPYEVIQGLTILVDKQKDFSFPSGHASAAFGVCIALLILLPKKTKWFGVVVTIFAVIISLSRLYVGVHYPSDVFMGALIGGICSAFVACLVKKLDNKYHFA